MGLGPAIALLQLVVFVVVFALAAFCIRAVRRSALSIVVLSLYLFSGLMIVYSSTPEVASPIAGHLLWFAAVHALFGILCIGVLVPTQIKSARKP